MLLLGLLSHLLAGSPALGSHSYYHAYIALKALDLASQQVKAVVLRDQATMEAYIAGACGQDLLSLAFLMEEALGWKHPGYWAHVGPTGKIGTRLFRAARSSRFTTDEQFQGMAYGLGWVTHFHTDCIVHGEVINNFGGPYEGEVS
ncbi:MAG: hypothetical protein FJY85_06745, partial [Deltaproteobacteria bacterium]|nr:hypothetical protein [Deltaproteobacteria bacterium]